MGSNDFLFTAGTTGRLDKMVVDYVATLPEDEKIILSRNQIEKLIRDGAITVNGKKITKPGGRIRSADEILISIPATLKRSGWPAASYAVTAEKMPLEILFEDESLLVINKAADTVVHPGAGNKTKTLMNGLKYYFEKNNIEAPDARFGLVHRLDKDTTGVLVVAKTTAALTDVQRQFAERSTHKTYVALVYIPPRGRHPFRDNDTGIITTGIRRSATNRLKMEAVIDAESDSDKRPAKTSVSEWRVLERGNFCGWLEITIKTGRTHQIRVHIEFQKSGIIGDPLYNQWCRLPADIARIATAFGRQALHAQTLTIVHPVTKNELTCTAPLPPDLIGLKNTCIPHL